MRSTSPRAPWLRASTRSNSTTSASLQTARSASAATHEKTLPRDGVAALRELLTLAAARLKPLGVKLSVDTFGLTTSVDHGMGIGQTLDQMADLVDFVSPMMYPSHYAHGEYGLKNPNRAPYETILHGVKDALDRLGARAGAMRPYLQDFSLGVRYTPAHVRAQILATEELGVRGWILWNAQNHYSWSAIQAGPVPKLPPEPPKAHQQEKR